MATAVVRVAELGPLGVAADGADLTLVRGERSVRVLSFLALRGHRGAGIDELVEWCWLDQRPATARRSLANVIRRFREGLGPDAIVTEASMYRLGDRVASDRSRFKTSIERAAGLVETNPEVALSLVGEALPMWRAEPWTGLDDDRFVTDRYFLRSVHRQGRWVRALALTRLGRGFEAARSLERLIQDDPLNEGFWAELASVMHTMGRRAEALRIVARARVTLAAHGLTPGASLATVERSILDEVDGPPGTDRRLDGGDRSERQVGTRLAGGRAASLRAAQVEVLHHCSARWLRGDVDGAVDALIAAGDLFDPDVLHRLQRCLTGIPQGERFARACWVITLLRWRTSPCVAIRSLISKDARALELAGADGLATADSEVDQAVTDAELMNALRVRFMVGLGQPVHDRQIQTVEALAAIDAPDAQVEAARFEAILEIKQGRIDEAIRVLDRYATIVAELWPLADDDFAAMALFVLAEHPDLADLGLPDVSGSNFPVFTADPMAARVARAWHHRPDPVAATAVPYGFHQVLDCSTQQCATALQLRWYLRTGQLTKADKYAARLVHQLAGMPRDRSFQAVLAALGEYAVQIEDRTLAGTIAELTEPWRGEMLGVWPLDIVIGPADRLLASLASIR